MTAPVVNGWPHKPCTCPSGGPYDFDCRDHGEVVWRLAAETWEHARSEAWRRADVRSPGRYVPRGELPVADTGAPGPDDDEESER